MPTLPTQSFQTIVQNIAAGVQGRANSLINFAIGATLRAIAEGFAGIFMWFQGLVIQLLSAIRLATSQGLDVDTFAADFMPIIPGSQTALLPGGSPRLGAQNASGLVIVSRLTAAPSTVFVPAAASVTQQGVITNAGTQPAAQFKTNDGNNTVFVVTVDTTNPNYNPTLGGYVMPVGITSMTVPVVALVPGTIGNVVAGAIALIIGAINGADNVTNPASFTNGANQESDTALKSRFAAFILGLSRGDVFGLTAAIEGTNVNVQFTLTENHNLDGTPHSGYFFVVADDGSGAPDQDFLNTITAAANSVRPLSVQFSVFPPTVIEATVGMQITVAAGFDLDTVISQVAATIATNIDGLGLGNSLDYGILFAWAFGVAGVATVTDVTLNGEQGDAASLSATKLATDGSTVIAFATIKAADILVS
jgi:phage-related baseplate assembly protein